MPYANIEDALYDPGSVITIAVDFESMTTAGLVIIAGHGPKGELLEVVTTQIGGEYEAIH